MSLIQDALKRQQEEMNKKAGEAPPSAASPIPGVKPVGKLETPGAPPPVIPLPRIPLRMMGQPADTPNPSDAEPKNEGPSNPVQPAPAPLPVPAKIEVPKKEAPPPLPRPDSGGNARNEPDSEKQKTVLLISTLVILLLVFAGLGLYWAWPRISESLAVALPSTAPAAVPVATSTTTSPDPAAATAPIETTPASTGSVAFVPSLEDPIVIPSQTNVPPPFPPSELLANASNKPTPLLTLNDPVPAPFIPVVAKAPPPAPPAIWPGVKLTGMVKLGGTAAALINGRIVAPGESIEDVTLIRVNTEGALLRFKGEERLLRVGETAR
jgi:hypothetical protein